MAKKHKSNEFSQDVRKETETIKARARRLQGVRAQIQKGTYDDKGKLTSDKVLKGLLTDMR